MIAIGMDRNTGRGISGIDHIKQSWTDILTTPIGSVVMNREYGSLIPELIDHPTNGANVLRLMTASVMALSRWDPRASISRVGVVLGEEPGATYIEIEGVRKESGDRLSAISMNVPIGGLR